VLDGQLHLLGPAEPVVHVISDVVREHFYGYNIFAAALVGKIQKCSMMLIPALIHLTYGTTNAKIMSGLKLSRTGS
jgi:hypothetical protein